MGTGRWQIHGTFSTEISDIALRIAEDEAEQLLTVPPFGRKNEFAIFRRGKGKILTGKLFTVAVAGKDGQSILFR